MAEIENKQSWNDAVNKYIDVHIVFLNKNYNQYNYNNVILK